MTYKHNTIYCNNVISLDLRTNFLFLLVPILNIISLSFSIPTKKQSYFFCHIIQKSSKIDNNQIKNIYNMIINIVYNNYFLLNKIKVKNERCRTIFL